MPTSISELIAALPEDVETAKQPAAAGLPALGSTASLPADVSRISFRPVPIGRFRRLTALGTLQAKIGAAYLFHWLRGWFKSADDQKRLLAETHWRTALKLLDSMSYLRGAVMKVGQTLANFPDIAPPEFVETLEQLHFDAPPMHWSLLRELVHNELGDDPENVFARFDERAFAAASLGQVHGAQLKTGEEVAIKIQYPGIARAVEADFRNLFLFLLPSRLGKDWESTKDQFDDLRNRIEQETDYVQEATHLEKARLLFRDADGIVVPRVFPQFSTTRILTMERVEGIHLREFIARNPSQDERNEVAGKILRAWYRMYYAGRMMYVDLHPGNFLVLDDGRLGLIDFGLVMPMDAEEWEWARRLDRPLTTGRQEDRIPAIKEWSDIRDDETDRLRVNGEFADWCWRSRSHAGDFDFGDEPDFRRGIEIFTELVRKRYSRARFNSTTIARCQFGMRAVLYLLKARIDLRPIAEEEVKAAGWDRSDYP
jgi:predicted unusual protein kinase regulating ubiquinone biosynthesis (AarF/ABC1/UbiB family)